jgi:hypothetical protein
MEAQRVAQLRKQTRPKFHRALREALQLSARLANSKDAYVSIQRVDAWLAEKGATDIAATPPRSRRDIQIVKWVGSLADLVRHLTYLAGAIGLVVVLFRAGTGLPEFVEQLRR